MVSGFFVLFGNGARHVHYAQSTDNGSSNLTLKIFEIALF